MKKRGDISITTIIVAAIALLVLIVLIAIFTGRISLFGRTYDAETSSAQQSICGTGGGFCVRGTSANCPAGYSSRSGRWLDCSDTSEVCCKPNA